MRFQINYDSVEKMETGNFHLQKYYKIKLDCSRKLYGFGSEGQGQVS